MKPWKEMDRSERHRAMRDYADMSTPDLSELLGMPRRSRTIERWCGDNGIRRYDGRRTSKVMLMPPIPPSESLGGDVWGRSDDARRQHNYRRMVEGARKTREAQQ